MPGGIKSLKKQKDFVRIIKEGKKLGNPDFILFSLKGEGRLGIRVPKVYGSAVKRNRLRRLLKEALRRENLSSDLIVMLKKSGLNRTPESLRESLLQLMKKKSLFEEKEQIS